MSIGGLFQPGQLSKIRGMVFQGQPSIGKEIGNFFLPSLSIYIIPQKFFSCKSELFQGFSIERFRHERFITSRTQRPTDRPIKLMGCAAGFLGGIRIGAMAPLASRVLCTPAFFLLLSSSIYIILQKFFYSKPAALHLCSARAAFWRFYSPESQSRITGRRLPSASMM